MSMTFSEYAVALVYAIATTSWLATVATAIRPGGLRTKVIHVGYLIQVRNLALQLLLDIFQVCTQVNARVQLEARVQGQAALLDGSWAMGQCNDPREGRCRGIREEVLGHSPSGDATGAKDEGHVILGFDHLERLVDSTHTRGQLEAHRHGPDRGPHVLICDSSFHQLSRVLPEWIKLDAMGRWPALFTGRRPWTIVIRGSDG